MAFTVKNTQYRNRIKEIIGMPMTAPTVSVVINTLDRAHVLESTIRSLRYQTYENFEVIVVNGPSRDGTDEILIGLQHDIKIVEIAEANLSKSRNAGIAAASGDLVLYLDDDAFAEPGWIASIVEAYRDPKVGGVGTRVWDHSGFQEQLNPRLIDKYYNPIFDARLPIKAFTYPDSTTIPHILGASSSFRMSVLRQIGGFDEEIEYFLDESEVCRRIAELGYEIRFLESGPAVHHKFAAGVVRDERRVLTHPYPVVKNKYYATLRDARGRGELLVHALKQCDTFAADLMSTARQQLSERVISDSEFLAFSSQVERGMKDGRQRGLLGTRQSRVFEPGKPEQFKAFKRLAPPGGARSFCFITRHLPTRSPGGIARFMYDLAIGFAARGHHVNVITLRDGPSEIEYQDGVWIRNLSRDHYDSKLLGKDQQYLDSDAGKQNWAWSMMAHAEVERIRVDAPVDLVIAPIWDTEGLHCVLDATMNTVIALQTTFKTFSTLEHRAIDTATANDLLLLEKLTLAAAVNVHAISNAIKEQISTVYRPRAGSRWDVAWLGLDHHPEEARLLVGKTSSDRVRVLYVSRLEKRKGTDIFLQSAAILAAKFENVEFTLIGRDGSSGALRATIDKKSLRVKTKFTFLGEVSDDDLLAAYREADIFCVPSRFESFGLIYLEAMRAGLPVVACNVGGVVEIVEDQVTGLLVPPDDPAALTHALAKLISDPLERQRLGENGRSRFETDFTSGQMVDRTLSLYGNFIKNDHPNQAVSPQASRIKICIVGGIVERYDATSEAILSTMYAASSLGPNVEARIYCQHTTIEDSRIHVVSSLAELVSEDYYQNSEIIIHHFGIFNELHSALAHSPRRAFLIVEFHGVTPPQFLPSEARLLINDSYHQMELFANADEIVVHTDYLEGEVRRIGIDRPMRKIELFGVNILSLEKITIGPSDRRCIRLVYCGRFVQSKQVVELLEILMSLASRYPALELTLIGVEDLSDPEYMRTVRALCSTLPKNLGVEILSGIPQSAVAEHIVAADLLVLPSLHEGFGMPVAEALAAGTPVVCSDAASLPEVAGGLAAIHTAGSYEDLERVLDCAISARVRGLVFVGEKELDYADWRSDALNFAKRYHRSAFEDRWREYLRPKLAGARPSVEAGRLASHVWATLSRTRVDARSPHYDQTVGRLIGEKFINLARSNPLQALDEVHQFAFERAMNEEGRDYWRSRLAASPLRKVVDEILNGHEVQGERSKRRAVSGIKTAISLADEVPGSAAPENSQYGSTPTREEIIELLRGIRTDSMFVEALYEMVLMRPAEAFGLEHHCANLAAGISREQLIDIFLDSEEFRRITSARLKH